MPFVRLDFGLDGFLLGRALKHNNKKDLQVKNLKALLVMWCGKEDLNLHTLRRQILSLVRLPFRHSRIWNLIYNILILLDYSNLLKCDDESYYK